jgi:hypothetical protein
MSSTPVIIGGLAAVGGAAIWIWTRQETPGESGVPDESLPVILLRSSCCYQFFSMSSEVGD